MVKDTAKKSTDQTRPVSFTMGPYPFYNKVIALLALCYIKHYIKLYDSYRYDSLYDNIVYMLPDKFNSYNQIIQYGF